MLLINRPFLSCLLPLCQIESLCKTIQMKMSSAYMYMYMYRFIVMQIKLIFVCLGKFCACTLFETEVQGNSDIRPFWYWRKLNILHSALLFLTH